ncbi:MAG: hypothetical protein A2516_04365 [Alphaproteobacteria bacterium RIFOXYD12_FULL_60_8]|nr:MAG: hypothetical protein A2516_04365 [Alphaproteobacteria bacterium RIFOXYD12_FULL_60_8]
MTENTKKYDLDWALRIDRHFVEAVQELGELVYDENGASYPKLPEGAAPVSLPKAKFKPVPYEQRNLKARVK